MKIEHMMIVFFGLNSILILVQIFVTYKHCYHDRKLLSRNQDCYIEENRGQQERIKHLEKGIIEYQKRDIRQWGRKVEPNEQDS